MRTQTHTTNELNTVADIIAIDQTTDTETLLSSGVPCGVQNLAGRRTNDAQFTASESTHMILMRFSDSPAVQTSNFIRCNGVVFANDNVEDAFNFGRAQRPGIWREIYCHATRTN